jgi:translation initiation factor 2 subunit 2
MRDYEKLLDNIYKNLPERVTHKERFEPPRFESFNEGNKTIIKNFGVVVDKLRRDKNIIVKWLSRELAVPITIEGDRVVLQRRLGNEILNKKLDEFIQKFVLCKECKKPDTRLVELGHGMKQLICEACGARNAVA